MTQLFGSVHLSAGGSILVSSVVGADFGQRKSQQPKSFLKCDKLPAQSVVSENQE